jgi:16S rRNA (uracil1498-N3)-methyltransferase
MHRFFLPPETSSGASLMLSGSEGHHALHVMRVRKAEQIILLDGAGGERLCEVISTGKSTLNLQVLEKRTVAALPYQLTLVQALPKGKLFESIIQKATELGVSRIVPLLSERVVSRLDGDNASQKLTRWQGVALEAIKQCGSAWLPKIDAPLKVEEFLQQNREDELALVGSLQIDALHPRIQLSRFERVHKRRPKSVCIWIGPEGDFAPAELQAIQSSGALPISLGRQVLRTETAAIYCLSVLNYELQAPVDKSSTAGS